MTLQELAKQIFDRFDKRICEAARGTIIPPCFIAGLVANESGRDRNGQIDESAKRFEPAVYAKLIRVRDTVGARYGSIKHDQIKDASDAAIRALATSWGATQMMGYHCLTLGCTLEDLRNPEKHFFYTVKLLLLNDQHDFDQYSEAAYDDEMRQWNTGRENGKTYHENYVPNARKIRAFYRELEKTRVHRSVEERVAGVVEDVDTTSEPALVQEAQTSGAPTEDASAVNSPNGGVTTSPVQQAPASEDGAAVTQYIPKITQARRWLGTLSLGGIFSTTFAAFAGLPPWAIFIIGMLTGIALTGLVILLIRHKTDVVNLVKWVLANNVDPSTVNVALTDVKEGA